uniref:Dynein heavy chain-like protein n=2 Tax=Talaromyces marneffei PM1 TaxID=1077442 RepID=A0A093XFG6_TALMA
MNAASSLGLPAMEDPFTDTMEMASPYNGHVDDFEIDIDIMEDQPANIDNDFDVQDATPDGASGEFNHDADMMEDVPEMTVTDTSTYHNDGNMQYADSTFFTTQEPVESEMVDEEYEENTETVPTSFETFATQQEGIKPEDSAELVNDQQANEGEGKDEEQQIVEEAADEVQSDVQEIAGQEATEKGQAETEVDAPHVVTESEVESATEHHPETTAEDNKDVEEVNEHTSVIEPGAEDDTAEEVVAVQNDGPNDLPPAGETEGAVESAHDSTGQTTYIHPVKVIYQESEISMFPPRHGNTSETYFLADEGLAYENIDRLFKECRAILGDHASNEDSLVFHIDSLSIELSEDNIHVSKFTLSQIVDTYLHLCRNSGIEQPEPLYLTLNTRAHLSSELTALLDAAKEGKGISDIQTWEEEYEHDETEDASEQHGDEHDYHAEEEIQKERLDNELAESRHHEDEIREDAEHDIQDRTVGAQELDQAGVEATDLQQYHNEEVDGELHTANDKSHTLAETQADLETLDNVEENEDLHISNQEPTAETGYQQQDDSSTNIGQAKTIPGDAGLVDDGNQEYPDNEHSVVPDTLDPHVEQNDGREDAITEKKDITTEPTQTSADVTAAEQYNETGGYGDEETAEQEEAVEQEEGEYDEDAGEENYEDYVEEEEEYHHDAAEIEEEYNDGSYVADQFDEASSKTVSASNEPIDKNDNLLDNLQTGTKADATESLDYTQDIPDLPDLPDDDLLDLDDDIFADTEQVTHRETEDSNGANASQIDDGHDASVEQATPIDDNQSVQLKRQGSTVGKRSRSDEEEELDFGVPSPGAKRTRAS